MDDGYSGFEFEDRPAFTRLRHELRTIGKQVAKLKTERTGWDAAYDRELFGIPSTSHWTAAAIIVWMEPWMEPFVRTIDAAKKYVVSSTLEGVDWQHRSARGCALNEMRCGKWAGR